MKARAELMSKGRRIEVETSPVYPGLPAVIPGAYWSDRNERWSLPLGMATCRLLRAEFGKGLEIGPKLWEWSAAEVAQERSQKALGGSLGVVDLPRITQEFPKLAQALLSRPYQTRGARFIANGKVVLLADDPGLGKTTEAIAGVIEAGVEGPYLIAAPVAAMSDAWEREIRARLGEAARIRPITGPKAKRQKALDEALWADVVDGEPMADAEEKLRVLDSTWVIVNIEMLRTKTWWICPQCEAENAQKTAAFEQAMSDFEDAAIFVLALPGIPVPVQERWEASDKPRAQIIDCGHNPLKVRTEHVHQYPQLFGRDWGAIIMDECQRSLLRNTGKQSMTRNGAMLLNCPDNGLRIALSGTPMRGKPTRLWGVLNWLDRKRFSSRWGFIQRYWEVEASGYGGALEIGDFIQERAEIFYTDLDRYMLRRSKAEVSPELPPKAYMGTPLDLNDETSPVAVWLPMTVEQTKAFREMASIGSAKVLGGQIDAVGTLAALTRLKQFSSSFGAVINESDFRPALPSNKVNWLEQFLIERNLMAEPDDAPTGKVVIVSQFTSLLRMIGGQFFSEHGLKFARVVGSVTGADRQRQIDRFNDPDSGIDVMLLNTLAGGVAVTLDSADDMVFLDETHVPDDQTQAEGRIDNRRPEVKVAQRRYWYVKSLGSVDEAIARTNQQRESDQRQHLDGRRGVEYAREVFATMDEMLRRGTK